MWFLQKSIRLLPHSRDSLKFCEMYHVSHHVLHHYILNKFVKNQQISYKFWHSIQTEHLSSCPLLSDTVYYLKTTNTMERLFVYSKLLLNIV